VSGPFPENVKTAAVVLAAGASRRLGRPKQQVVLGGETLVARAVRVALAAGLSPVIAVVRPEGDFGHSLQEQGAVIVLNDRADEGMSASIRLGVNVARMVKSAGAVLMTCDQVAVTAEHLRALCAEPKLVTASEYAGRKGVPAYFPASAFAELMKLEGDAGARELLRAAATVVDESLALDVDTEEDVAKAQRWIVGLPVQ
jgi:CTP:molybdopterin cytidylyltransferase MocA